MCVCVCVCVCVCSSFRVVSLCKCYRKPTKRQKRAKHESFCGGKFIEMPVMLESFSYWLLFYVRAFRGREVDP